MRTVVCAFDDRSAASIAMTRLVLAGVPRNNVHLEPEPDQYASDTELRRSTGAVESAWVMVIRSLFESLANKRIPGEEGTYRDAVRRGSTVVVTHVDSDAQARRVGELMTALGAFDVEQRTPCWKNFGSG